jgi:hypothetical protein
MTHSIRHSSKAIPARKALLTLAGALTMAALPATAMAAPAAQVSSTLPDVAVAPQYDTTHVYVAPADVDAFVRSFTATFGGASTPQGIATVTPTPSSTSTQLVQTPAGTVSLFGFRTPIPWPFGAERTGWLVKDMDAAIALGPRGGGRCHRLHLSRPHRPRRRDPVAGRRDDAALLAQHPAPLRALCHAARNRVYVSADRADAFVKSFSRFAHAKVVSDDRAAPGVEIGKPNATYRRIRLSSSFGLVTVLVTDGKLPWPYGREITGYTVTDLTATLAKATASGAKVIVEPYTSGERSAAFVEFPGGYIAEIHAAK